MFNKSNPLLFDPSGDNTKQMVVLHNKAIIFIFIINNIILISKKNIFNYYQNFLNNKHYNTYY